MSTKDTPKYVILRCCRDWPIQIESAYHRGGKCGLCGESPQLILEEYQSEKLPE